MRLLLTQSQVSVVVSSSVVVIFTLLLFLSGFILQQRTVSSLKETVKPRIPKPPPHFVINDRQAQQHQQPLQSSRLFGRNSGESGGHVAHTDFNRAKDGSAANIDWKRLAHAQLVKSHHDVCSAIMVLAELHKQKSPARRMLMFPQAWAAEKGGKGKDGMEDPFTESSRRLIRLAARRYGVELRPVAPVVQSTEQEDERRVDTYSLASAFALKEFDRVMSIETPGLIMDALSLDAVLAFTEKAPFAMLHATAEDDGVHPEDLMMLQPDKQIHAELVSTIATQSAYNDTLLPSIFPDPLLLESSSTDSALVRSIGTLHNAQSNLDFNSTAFISNVAYIRFSDPKLPGPEYDVPWSQKVAARPKNTDADWTWTKLYGEFAQKRMEVCGLDLDHWHGVTDQT